MNTNRLYNLIILSLFFVLPLCMSSAYSGASACRECDAKPSPVAACKTLNVPQAACLRGQAKAIRTWQACNAHRQACLQKKPVEWLFVITAKDGEIKKGEQTQFILTLEHTKIERVLAFSDRPNRIVKFISPKDFKKLWGEGKNSFHKDPPNAVAVFGQEKIAMKLIGVSVDKDKTTFFVTSDDDNIRDVTMGEVSVFVDASTRGGVFHFTF